MYRAVKYWGKKPHNIWNQYIERYCPLGGTILDPFVGSGVAAFEAAKIGRKALAFDLNPLSAFIIEVLSKPFDEAQFLAAFAQIENIIESDPVYREHYTKEVQGRPAVIFNYRWFAGKIVKVALKVRYGKKIKSAFVTADSDDIRKAKEISTIKIPFWFPKDKFPTTPSITHKFISDVGGDQFEHLWTRRNLYLLARIFHEIEQNPDEAEKRLSEKGFKNYIYILGDSKNKIDQIAEIDYIVTSPPYHNILKNDGKGLRYESGKLYRMAARNGIEHYGEIDGDLGNFKEYADFLKALKAIMKKAFSKLRAGRYCSIIMSDFTVNKAEMSVQSDILQLMQDCGFEFSGTTVLLQPVKPLFPFGYPYAYKINHHHQNIMTFRKPKLENSLVARN